MRIKELFTVPEGEKVTEKVFGRVLVSSICSILLCIACLGGTTWAWFTVSIENTGNVIQIAAVKQIVIINNADNREVAKADNGSYNLDVGNYSIHIQLDRGETGSDDFHNQKKPMYVEMAATHNDAAQHYYFAFEGGNEIAKHVLEVKDSPVVISFSATWQKPAATLIDDETFAVSEAKPS